MRSLGICLCLAMLVLLATSGSGFALPTPWAEAAPLGLAPAQESGQLDAAVLGGLKWRSIGPDQGGRISNITVVIRAGVPDAIYAATASGGLWRSTNQGTTWEPLFDEVNGLISIGDVAVAPSNPNLIWVGTGEPNNRQSSAWGEGVYKSADGGRTWEHMGLKETRHVGRIVIHPTDPDIVYVAAVGHLWGANPERGVFRTTDGGETWENVLYIDEDTGAIDLAMSPSDPKTLFAAMYQRRRTAWGFSGGGPGSGLYRSLDGGASWTELTNGLPDGDKGRIGIAVYSQDSNLVYAIVEADPQPDFGTPPAPPGSLEGGVFRSTDRGETWEQMNPLNPRPMYYSQIRIDPGDPNRIYVLGGRVNISDDGGRTFRDSSSDVHWDDHALWIDPRDSNHLILGHDVGVAISWDRAETWRFIDHLPIGQFYEIGVDMRDPYYVCGGLQDNSSWCVPSATRDTNGITNHEAYIVGGGDGFYVQIDPNDHTIIFVEAQNGRIARTDLTSGESQFIQPVPKEKPEDDGEYRWNWNTPILLSVHDSATLYAGSNVLSKSTDRGMSWTVISPDLTSNTDRDKLETMGRKVTEETLSRHDGISSYGNLTTISESPLDRMVLYTGSDDGLVHFSRDGGANWTNITDISPELPPSTYVSRLVASRHVAGRVYATFDGHYNDDYRPHVYVSDDYGQSWRSLTVGLPEETSVNIIREHPRNPNLIFVGHEKGVHVSIDGGASWASLNSNMPSVPVDDLIVHPRENDLIAGTHGRSIWIMDDIGPLEALTPEALAAEARLSPVRRARLFNLRERLVWRQFKAPNPEYGALITYYLRDARDQVELSIRDASGEVLRTLEGPAERGFNRVAWDLRMEPPYESGPSAPRVLPGDYRVTVSIPRGTSEDGDAEGVGAAIELWGQVTVEGDPLIDISDTDRQARQAALLDLHELLKTLGAAQVAAETLSQQIALLKEQLAGRSDDEGGAALEQARSRVEQLAERISKVQEDLQDQGRAITGWQNAKTAIDDYTGLPRPDQVRQISWRFEDVTEIVQTLNRLLQTDIPALYAELQAQKLWPTLAPISPPDTPDPPSG